MCNRYAVGAAIICVALVMGGALSAYGTEAQGVDCIQYRIDGAAWANVPTTLYVPWGTDVDFRAVPFPAEADTWPTGYPEWGGTSGAQGTGEYTSVTFYDLSQSSTDYKSVTCSCSNVVMVNVIVYDLMIRASDGVSWPPDMVAVGESIQLRAVTSPTISGSYAWTENSDAMSLSGASSQTVTVNGSQSGWGSVNVAFTPSGSGKGMDWFHDVCVVGIEELWYRVDGGSFEAVTGTIIVPLGATVEFEALPSGGAWGFPDGYPDWSGTSGATGSGYSKSVTFNTASSSGSDFKTVTATCGTTSETANVLVCQLETLQYSMDGTSYSNVTSTIFVARDSTVHFKAIPMPSGAVLPGDQPEWSGQVWGTGETKQATFTWSSSSATDYQSVSATWGSTVSANVIVYEVEIRDEYGGWNPAESVSCGRSAQLMAVPYPEDLVGTFAWSASGGKVTLAGAGQQVVTINGTTASDYPYDTDVSVAFTAYDGENASETDYAMTCVGVDYLEFEAMPVGPADTVYLGIGSGGSFYAAPKPSGVWWPMDGGPVWGGMAAGQEGEFAWVDAASVGNGSVSVTAGDSVSVDVTIYDLTILAGDGVSAPPTEVGVGQSCNLSAVTSDPVSGDLMWMSFSGNAWLENDMSPVVTVHGQTPSGSAGDTTIDVEVWPWLGTPAWASHDMTVVGMERLEYQIDGGGWNNVWSTIEVVKGATVEFRAVVQPAGASWPDGTPSWGGTSGASGVGEQVSVTFSTASSDMSDYKTVTATCGDTLTAEVIVIGLDSIEYSVDGAPYLPVTDTIYVRQWANVDFRAVPTPAGAQWPWDQPEWSGEASGSGEYAWVSFPTLSATAQDAFEVIASCGEDSETADVIVYDVLLTASDGFSMPPEFVGVNGSQQVTCTLMPDIGGTFSWMTGSAKVSLSGAASQTVTVTGLAVSDWFGDADLLCEYTPPSGGEYIPMDHWMTVVGMGEIWYSVEGGDSGLADVPFTVPLGATVNFEAWPAPAGAWFPDENDVVWSGAATGTGTMAQVTFNTGSTSDTDYKTVTATYGNSVDAQVLVAQIDKIQYSTDGVNYENVPATLHVPDGSTVYFKAVPVPSSTTFPQNEPQWGGSSGANGEGETVTVTFNGCSADLTDFREVTATWGQSEETASVIVYSVEVVAPDDGMAEELVGCGASIELKVVVTPEGLSGAYGWTASNGHVSLTNANQAVVTVNGQTASSVAWDTVVTGAFSVEGSPAASVDHTITCVAVDYINFESWSGSEGLGTVCMAKDTSGGFQAVPVPLGVGWPEGLPTWSGIAEGQPAGDFVFVDADALGEDTITSTTGANPVTEDVLVYELEIVAMNGSDAPVDVLLGQSVSVMAELGEPLVGEYLWESSSEITVAPPASESVSVTGEQLSQQLGDAQIVLLFTPNGPGTPGMASHAMTVKGIGSVEYWNGFEYQEATQPIHVPLGTQLSFRAVIQPEGATWPDNLPTWTGPQSQTGQLEYFDADFLSASVDLTDYQEVTATCGNSVTAEVLVVEVSDIQYQKPDGTWETVEDTLYVKKDSYISFRAVPCPAVQTWPGDTPVWGGILEGEMSGGEAWYEFDTATEDVQNPFIVSAECCALDYTEISVVVYTLDLSYTPEPHTIALGGSQEVTCTVTPDIGGDFLWEETSLSVSLANAQAATVTVSGDVISLSPDAEIVSLTYTPPADGPSEEMEHWTTVVGVYFLDAQVAPDALEWLYDGDTFHVPVGSEVNYLAWSDPMGAEWPSGTPDWFFDNADDAEDTEYAVVTYDTASENVGDVRTVEVDCGASILAVNVLVYEATIMAANGTDPAPSFIPKGETVQLKLVISPEVAGTYAWSTESNKITLQNETDQTVTLIANETSSSIDDIELTCSFSLAGKGIPIEVTHTITIFKVQVVVGEVAEDDEEDPGAFVPYKGFTPVRIEPVLPSDLPGGPEDPKVVIDWSGSIAVYQEDGQTLLERETAEYSLDELPVDLYVYGDDVSGALMDCEMKACYTLGSLTSEDIAKITVVKVNLDINGKSDSEEATGFGRSMSCNNDYDEGDQQAHEQVGQEDCADRDLKKNQGAGELVTDSELVELTAVAVLQAGEGLLEGAVVHFEQEGSGSVRVFAVKPGDDAREVMDASATEGIDIAPDYLRSSGQYHAYNKFYVEGVSNGTVALKLVYERDGEKIAEDTVLIRVETVTMYVAYARYCANYADNTSIADPDGGVFFATLANGIYCSPTFGTKDMNDNSLPKQVRCRNNHTGVDITLVYSAEANAWNSFLAAWQSFDIVAYSGHANSGQYWDIGPNVTDEEAGEHQGTPKNGYKVLMDALGADDCRARLYVSLSCYPETPYMLLDSATVRLSRHFTSLNAIGHRKSGNMVNSNRELVGIVEAVLGGKNVDGETLRGLDVLSVLTAEDVGVDDGVSVYERDQRRASFESNGASAIWHHLDSRPSYRSAWENGWHAYTEHDLILGAQGQMLQDGVFDDSQDVAKGATTPEEDTVIISAGGNGFLETVKDGDDVYDNPDSPRAILAGPNKIADTSATGQIGSPADGRQFWLQISARAEGRDLSWMNQVVLQALIATDAIGDSNLFQFAVRAAIEPIE